MSVLLRALVLVVMLLALASLTIAPAFADSGTDGTTCIRYMGFEKCVHY